MNAEVLRVDFRPQYRKHLNDYDRNEIKRQIDFLGQHISEKVIVTVLKTDGEQITGELMQVKPTHILVEVDELTRFIGIPQIHGFHTNFVPRRWHH